MWRRSVPSSLVEKAPDPIAWPGSPLSPALRTILIAAASPVASTTARPLVAYVSHPAGAHNSDWRLELLPNTAVTTLEEARPDALVIDASAAVSGSPWVGAGSEIDPKRTWEIVELIRVGRHQGIPIVFRWDVPAHRVPMLRRVASLCDVIATAEPGLTPEELPLLPHRVDPESDELHSLARLTGVERLGAVEGGGM